MRPTEDKEIYPVTLKYMSCEGPTTALEMLTQACEKRNLPWRINSAPPTRPTPFFDNQTHKPHRELAARPEGPPKPFTPQHRPHLNTHPFPPPLSLPLSFPHRSFVHDPPPPPRPWLPGPPGPLTSFRPRKGSWLI